MWVTEQIRPAHTHLGSSDERLALYVLHTLPRSLGVPFVPEHIETRRLFSQLMPGLEQVVKLLVFLPLSSFLPLFWLDKGETFPLLFDSHLVNQDLVSPPSIAMPLAALCFAYVTFFFKCCLSQSTTGGRIATRIVALTSSMKQLLRLWTLIQ